MKHFILTLICFFTAFQQGIAQNPQKYTNEREETHLAGPVTIQDFKNDTTYNKWFSSGYEEYTPFEKKPKWAKNLKNTQVKIFMGTWCGDSQEWVPRFIKLWDELNLDRSKIAITALYDLDEKYKQGPNGEEKGWNIHRVPTFIFLKDGKEYARIVEHPRTDLLSDVAQIALGYPSTPSYEGANYLLNLFDQFTLEEIYKDYRNIYLNTYYKSGKYIELNTLGHVLTAADRKEQALFVYQLNSYFFKGNWYTHFKLAQAFEEAGEGKAALTSYEAVLNLKPDHEESITAVEKLKKELKEEAEFKTSEG